MSHIFFAGKQLVSVNTSRYLHKQITCFLTIFHIAGGCFAYEIHWQSDYTLDGLSGKRIYALEYSIKNNCVIAGTNMGLFVKKFTANRWDSLSIDSSTLFRVCDLDVSENTGSFIAVIELNSARWIIKECPIDSAPWYMVKEKVQISNVLAACFSGDADTSNYFIVCPNRIAMSKSPNNNLATPAPNFNPQSQAGCVDIQYDPKHNFVYAGGFNFTNPSDRGILYEGISGANLTQVATIPVVSIEIRTIEFLPNNFWIAVGSAKGNSKRIYSPYKETFIFPYVNTDMVKNDSIRQLQATSVIYVTGRQQFDDLVCVATRRGMYCYFNPFSTDTIDWKQVGLTKLNVLSLSPFICHSPVQNIFVIYVGTTNGVYRISCDIPTGVSGSNATSKNSITFIQQQSDAFSILFHPSFSGRYSFDFLSAQGRRIFAPYTMYCVAGRNEVSLSPPQSHCAAGRYYLRITSEDKGTKQLKPMIIQR